MKFSQTDVNKLSRTQRNLLIEHIDGPIPFTRTDSNRIMALNALLERGLLRNQRPGPDFTIRPRALILSEIGRQAVSILLADYADALIRAGCLEPDFAPLSPMAILKQLKAAGPKIGPKSPVLAEIPLIPSYPGSK